MTSKEQKAADLVALYSRVQDQLQAEKKTTLAVIQARISGASWSQVGSMLGVSPQAAWLAYHELDIEQDGSVPPGPAADAPTG